MTYSWPAIVGILVLMLMAGTLIARWFRIARDDREGLVGALIAPTLLAVYLVVSALGIVIGWENTDAGKSEVADEAVTVTNLYWVAGTQPADGAVKRDLRAYVTSVVRDEWPAMADGDLSDTTDQHLRDLRRSVAGIKANSYSTAEDRMLALQDVDKLVELRSDRDNVAGPAVPPLLVAVTLLTALIVAALPFAAGAGGSRANIFWSVVSLAFVAGSAALLLLLDNAYAGPLAVTPTAISDTLTTFTHIDQTLR
ncbi:MAG TPA: hypothetical protein VGL93_15915 [Streptosporangiaceae bacterium]|jgi:hypothetical protein